MNQNHLLTHYKEDEQRDKDCTKGLNSFYSTLSDAKDYSNIGADKEYDDRLAPS